MNKRQRKKRVTKWRQHQRDFMRSFQMELKRGVRKWGSFDEYYKRECAWTSFEIPKQYLEEYQIPESAQEFFSVTAKEWLKNCCNEDEGLT